MAHEKCIIFISIHFLGEYYYLKIFLSPRKKIVFPNGSVVLKCCAIRTFDPFDVVPWIPVTRFIIASL
jgi:hypothetical protein